MPSNPWRRSCLALSFITMSALAACGDDKVSDAEIGCRLNSDCAIGQLCEQGVCVLNEDACEGPQCPCTSNAGCGAGQGCDVSTGACFDLECLNDGDCALGEVCLGGLCETDVDADRDRDGVPDTEDRCPETQDADQEDHDADGLGDACDADDDNDAIPDASDNCPRVSNAVQGDADDNGQGNACDAVTPGISVVGQVDFSILPTADTTRAQVFVSGQEAPGVLTPDGTFAFEHVLPEPGAFLVRVVWPGFVPVVREAVALDNQPTVSLQPVVMTLAGQGDAVSAVSGRASLADGQTPRDIVVQAKVEGTQVLTTLTGADGGFVMQLGPVTHTLEFSKAGYATRTLEVRYNAQGDNAGRFTYEGVPLEEVEGITLERLTGQAQVRVLMTPAWIPEGQRAVTVTLLGAGQERSAVLSGGSATFTDLPVGDYIAFAERPGFTLARQSFQLNDTTLDASLELNVHLVDLAQAGLNLTGLTLQDSDLRDIASLRGANLNGVTLVGELPEDGAQLCDLNLDGVSMIDANLRGASLAGASLVGARLDGALLERSSLRGADLSSASLFGADLSEANLSNGEYLCQAQTRPARRTLLRDANLSGATLRRARFVEGDAPSLEGDPCAQSETLSPDLSAVRWTQADLSQAILHTAALSQSNVNAAFMNEADLRGACLRGATLARSDLSGAQLQGADMAEVSLFDTLMVRSQLDAATMTQANLSGVNLTEATLDGVRGEGVSMVDVVLNDASMVGADVTGSQWVGELLSGVDLSGAVLNDADLRNVQFVDVALTDVQLVRADLRNASLVQLDLQRANLSGALLNGTNLSGSNFESAIFDDAELLGADLSLARYNPDTRWPEGFEFRTVGALGPEAQLDNVLFPAQFSAVGVDLTDASLVGARLNGVDLTDATMVDADMRGVLLSNADLSGADLSGATLLDSVPFDILGCPQALPLPWRCTLQPAVGAFALIGPGADLRDANLRSINLVGADLTDADLRGANISGAVLDDASLGEVMAFDLRGDCPRTLPTSWSCTSQPANGRYVLTGPRANLLNADLSGANLVGVNLRNASLRFTILSNASLTNADLTAADLQSANLSDGLLRGTTLRSADLNDADLRNANLSSADLRNANLEGTALSGANMSDVNLNEATTINLLSCPRVLPPLWNCVLQPLSDLFVIIGL